MIGATSKICYLVNCYPKISHTFIRREIMALEELGAVVTRVSLRSAADSLTDVLDIAENTKTVFVIDGSKIALLLAFISCLFRRPIQFIFGLRKALHFAGLSGKRLIGLIYFVEACRVLSICKQNQVDHLHAHFGTNSTTIAAITRAMGGPAYSFTVHGPDEFDSPRELGLKTKIADSKFVVAISSFCKSQLFRWANFSDWEKIKIVHCSIDGEILSKSTLPIKNSNRLLHIGRLCEQKGQLLLLKAVAQVKSAGVDIKLDIVGDGDYRKEMMQFIGQNQLENTVNILGWRSGEEILNLLDDCSAMILPSFAEGLPVVIMESFGRARPVITTHIAAIPELVDESCGFLVAPGSVDELVEKIMLLSKSNTESLDELGMEGRRRVVKYHNALSEARTLLNFIQEPRLETTKPQETLFKPLWLSRNLIRSILQGGSR